MPHIHTVYIDSRWLCWWAGSKVSMGVSIIQDQRHNNTSVSVLLLDVAEVDWVWKLRDDALGVLVLRLDH